jgi:hypothetical protein
MNDATTETAAAKTLTLGGKTYTVVSASDRAIALAGPRRGEYVLIRNARNPAAWALISAGSMKPRTEWYLRNESGAFVSADML